MTSLTSQEIIDITTNLNTAMFNCFLAGIYTLAYFGTLYVYLTRKASQRRIILVTITALYLIFLFNFGLLWYLLNWQFIRNVGSLESVTLAFYTFPHSLQILAGASAQLLAFIADGLMIWRCFHVWNKSWRAIVFPLVFWIIEVGVNLASTILFGIFGSAETSRQAKVYTATLTASALSICVTSMVTTALIAYRIISVLKEAGKPRRRFNRIIDIVIQSSAIYTLSYLAQGIFSLPCISFSPGVWAAANYSNCLAIVVSGLAPTVMVARVALLSPDTTYPGTTTIHFSNLRFGGNSAGQNENSDIRSTDIITDDEERLGALEEKIID